MRPVERTRSAHPGLDLQRASGADLEAAILVRNKIALGQIDAGIAGGVDSVSDVPMRSSTRAPINRSCCAATAGAASVRASRRSSLCDRAISGR